MRLHRGLIVKAEVEANLDVTDNGVLRSHFDAMVKAQTGTLNTDLTKWTLRVHGSAAAWSSPPSGSRPPARPR
ncbi:hypothetical protein ACQSSU_20850 [Micromonospora echinospora]